MSPDQLRDLAARHRQDQAELQALHDAMTDPRLWWLRVDLAHAISSTSALATRMERLAASAESARKVVA